MCSYCLHLKIEETRTKAVKIESNKPHYCIIYPICRAEVSGNSVLLSESPTICLAKALSVWISGTQKTLEILLYNPNRHTSIDGEW